MHPDPSHLVAQERHTSPEPSAAMVRDLARALYTARLQTAWGAHWIVRDRWPADAEAWREYPHAPSAEVDLAIAQARAAFAWFADAEHSAA
jgi:hypothetical protein